MKKSLLIATMALAAFAANAAKDAYEYPTTGGYTLTNICQNSIFNGTWATLVHDVAGTPGDVFPSFSQIRNATCVGGKVYVASSNSWGEGGTVVGEGALFIFDANTGEYEKSVQLVKEDGTPISGTLCANVIGQDDFGHMYVGGYRGSLWLDTETTYAANPIEIFLVNPETGACTLAASLELPETEADKSGRVDQFDVIGDLTCEKARCVVMAPVNGAPKKEVVGWHCEQGEEEWAPHMNNGENVACELSDEGGYPANVANFSSVGVAIIRDEEFSGDMFYTDAFNTFPEVWNTEGALIDDFSVLVSALTFDEVAHKQAPAGVAEFTFGDQLFLLAGLNEYTAGEGAQARVYKLGENGAFEGAEPLFNFPHDGLGDIGNGTNLAKGGTSRLHKLEATVVEDGNGKYGAYIFTYKDGNGFAYYLFAEEGFNAGGIAAPSVAETNAPVEYFNLQGIRVANPENGLFIRRQGTTATKVLL